MIMGPLPLALLLALPLVSKAQEAKPPSARAAEVPVVSVDVIELRTYAPLHVPVDGLLDIAERTVGRKLFVIERGGEQGPPVDNLSRLGGSIVMYDEPAYVARMLSSLQALDKPPVQGDADALVVREYAPRYISLSSAGDALQPFQRRYESGGGATHTVRDNVSYLRERNQIVLRDTEENLGRMQDLLQRLDVPEPQALLTCYLVQADPSGDGAGLPKDLLANLGRIVPQFRFRSLGFALLQTSIAPGRNLSLRIDGGPEVGFDLSFSPVAYDPSTASLSVQNCILQRDQYTAVTRDGVTERQRAGDRRLFSTNTVFRGGEYTVLGATGAEPVFLVVRLTPVP
jgi:hypothetical protein